MFVIRFFIISILLITNLYSQNELDDRYSFGVSINNFNSSNQNRMKRLTLNLLDNINNNYKKEINMVFYENEEELLKDFKEKKNINGIVIFSNFYLQNKELLREISKNPFIYKSSKTENSQFYLVANKKSNIKSIDDIVNKTFIHSIHEKNYSVWLDYISLKKFNKSYLKIVSKELLSEKTSTSLLDVYFGKADFCVLSKDVYEDVVSLNPSIVNNLTIVEKSPEIFFFAFSSFHKDVSSELVSLLNNVVNNGKFEDDFKELFSLINLDNVKQVEFKDLEKIDKFYDEYKILKAGNK